MASAKTRPHTLQLSDVSDPAIMRLLTHIYSFLQDGTDIPRGMLVCSSFTKDLPSLVTEVTIRIKNDTAKFDQQQLQHLAQAFPNMQKLSVSQECSHLGSALHCVLQQHHVVTIWLAVQVCGSLSAAGLP